MVIVLEKLRDLTLPAGNPTGRPHLSAASGLVRIGTAIHVVADDENHLGTFAIEGMADGQLTRLLPGSLPAGPADRKRRKPDFETLVRLPPLPDLPGGALLAMGSGSTATRRRGALIRLASHGGLDGAPQAVDLSALHAGLAGVFAEVNVEGAVVVDGELCLFQRGNVGNPENAIARFDLAAAMRAVMAGSATPLPPLGVRCIDLGQVDGIPLCFTDACALDDGRIAFTAVAEDTSNAYDDGACIGACVGLLEADGSVATVRRFDRPWKVEGVDATRTGNRLHLLLVTDADDPRVPASLYAGTLPLPSPKPPPAGSSGWR